MSNMDDFNRCTALVQAKLYDEFPQEIILNLRELAPDIEGNTIKNFAATVDFLAEEGFITCGNSIDQGTRIAKARLTSKGLSILKSIPDVLGNDEKMSFADKIKTVIQDGSKQALNGVISQAIAAFVKFALS